MVRLFGGLATRKRASWLHGDRDLTGRRPGVRSEKVPNGFSHQVACTDSVGVEPVRVHQGARLDGARVGLKRNTSPHEKRGAPFVEGDDLHVETGACPVVDHRVVARELVMRWDLARMHQRFDRPDRRDISHEERRMNAFKQREPHLESSRSA